MPTLSIDIAARLATFQDSLDKIGRQSEQLAGRLNKAFGTVKGTLAGLGASLSVGALVSFVKTGIDAADNFGKLSQRIGVSVESISALNYAAALSDVSIEQLGDAMTKLAKAASDTSGGTGEAINAFRALGVNVKDAQGALRGTEDLLLEISDKFSKMADGSGKTAIALKIFGESGSKLIPFLNQGREGLEALRKEAERLGIVISGDTARRAEEFNDNMTRLRAAVDGARIAIGKELLPALTQIAQRMAEAAKSGGPLIGILEGMREAVTQLFESSRKSRLLDDLDELEKKIARTVALIQSGKMNVPLFGEVGLNENGRASLTKNLDADIASAQRLRDLIALINGSAFDKKGGAPQPGANDIVDYLAASRARAESEIKKLRDALKDEEAAISGSIDILSTMLGQNLISYQTFYDERARLQREALDATIKAAEEEIRVATRLRSQLPKEADRTQQDDRIREAQGRIEEARRKAAQDSVKSFYDQQAAAKAYAQALTDIEIQIREIDGDVVGAALGRFAQATRTLQEQAQAQNDTGTLGRVDELRQRVGLQAKVNDLLQQAQLLGEQVANAEARVSVDRQTGAAGELTSLQRLSSIRQASLPQYQEIADKLGQIRDNVTDPRLRQQIDNFQRSVDEFAAAADAVGNKFREIGEGAFGQFFEDILEGTKSVKDAFRDMGNSILREVNRLVSQDIAKKIFGSLGGSGSGGGQGGGIASLFGDALKFIFGGFRAEGGPVSPGRGYIVGENGPEWFMPRQAGAIVPAGGGGQTINYSPTFVIKGDMTPQSRSQLSAAALRGLQEGRRNL